MPLNFKWPRGLGIRNTSRLWSLSYHQGKVNTDRKLANSQQIYLQETYGATTVISREGSYSNRTNWTLNTNSNVVQPVCIRKDTRMSAARQITNCFRDMNFKIIMIWLKKHSSTSVIVTQSPCKVFQPSMDPTHKKKSVHPSWVISCVNTYCGLWRYVSALLHALS